MSRNKYHIDFLFPRTNAFVGAGSVFNLAGNYFEFNIPDKEQDADFHALENDWGMIGKDMSSVINENPTEQFSY